MSFGNDADGEKVVAFDCVPASAPMAPRPDFNPNLAYNYRSDQELVGAARNALIYCMNRGSQQVVSTIVTNANGTRTVTFYFNPRQVSDVWAYRSVTACRTSVMSMSRIIGLVVLAIGVVLLGFAFHSTNAPMEELSNTLTGRYSNRTM